MELSATVSSVQGEREYQEDRLVWVPKLTANFALAAVFDGHVGDQASEFAKRNIERIVREELARSSRSEADVLRATVQRLEYEYNGKGFTSPTPELERISSTLPNTAGTTAVIALFSIPCKSVSIANVGDSRAVLRRGDDVYQLTGDHNIESLTTQEKSAIKATGVAKFGRDGYLWTETTDGSFGLNVLRTLGDPLFKSRFHPDLVKNGIKTSLIPWHPDIFRTVLRSGDYVVMASDGVFNFVNNSIVGALAPRGADIVTRFSLEKGKSSDNVSAIVVSIH